MKKEFKHLLYRTLYLVKQKLLKSQSEKLCYSIKRKVFNLASGILERKRRLLKMKQFHVLERKVIRTNGQVFYYYCPHRIP